MRTIAPLGTAGTRIPWANPWFLHEPPPRRSALFEQRGGLSG
jgi:hypothetical protein